MASDEAHENFQFRYKADEWKRVAAELPKGAPVRRIRWEIELNCSGFLFADSLSVLQHIHRRKRQWSAFATKARSLLDAWPERERDGEWASSGSPLALLYEELEAVVAKIQTYGTPLARHRGTNQITRNVFIGRLIQIWADSGGRVGSSTHSETGKASGPLIRFLIAATAPVLKKELTPDAARARIRKFESRWLEPPMVN